ncbi:nitroreductase [Myxococcota bacterium]|nr:nitroreductase [Myxococcota bacterium]
MTHEHPILETIRQRTSVRTFDGRPVDAERIAALKEKLAGLQQGPFGCRCRFALLDMSGFDPKQLKQYGTYGLIQGTRFFIAGAVEDAPGNLEDFGYLMEVAVLACAELELGTCWLGGVLNRSAFGRELDLKPGELIPAVTPVGIAADHRSFKDKALRFMAGSAKRKPWKELFFDEVWGRPFQEERALSAKSPEGLQEAFEAVRLAPSASNKQPWRVVWVDGAAHFYLERSAVYSKIMEMAKMPALQRVDLGIAMAHFDLVTAALGQAGMWTFEAPSIPGVPASASYTASWRRN